MSDLVAVCAGCTLQPTMVHYGILRGAESGRNSTKTSGVPFAKLWKRSGLAHSNQIAAGLRPQQQ